MNWQPSAYAASLWLGATLSLALAVYGWRRRASDPGVAFALFMAGVALWSAAYALELESAELRTKLFWANIQYFGIVAVPAAWFVFALQKSGFGQVVDRRLLGALAIEPAITLALAWTSEGHRVFRTGTHLETADSLSFLVSEFGPGFWVHAAYSYLLFFTGIALTLRMARTAARLYRGQAAVLVVAGLTPWLANLIYLSGRSPWGELDLSPFGFMASGVLLAIGLRPLRLLDIVPMARSAVFEEMSDGVIVANVVDRIVDLNPAAARMLGPAAAGAVGQPVACVLPSRPGVEASGEILVNGGGQQRHLEVRRSQLRSRVGEPKGSILLLRDVTDRKQAEAALHAEEARLVHVVGQLPAILWTTDRDLRIVSVAGQGLEATGLTPGQAIGTPIAQWADETSPSPEAHRRALAGESVRFEIEFRGRTLASLVEPLRVSEGSIAGVIGLALDITGRRQSEREREVGFEIVKAASETDDLDELLRRIHASLRSVLYAEDCFVALRDPGTGLFSFPFLVDRFDTRPQPQSLGRSCAAYVFRTGRPALIDERRFRELVEQGEVELVGTPSPVWLGAPLVTPSGTIGVLALQHYEDPNAYSERDLALLSAVAGQIALVIERRRAHQAHEQVTETLRRHEAMSALGSLVAGVAHEVRNPLFSISATLDAFAASFAGQADAEPHFRTLQQQVARLSDLMNDLLAYGKPSSLELAECPVADILAHAAHDCGPLAKEARVTIESQAARGMTPVRGDRKRLVQAFQNLVQNAIQHCRSRGSVTLTAREGRDDGRPWIECAVLDNGPGFRQEDLARVFEPFFTRRRGGTGLGLAIAQRIVEAHGGSIAAGNRVEGGGVINVRLPVGKSAGSR